MDKDCATECRDSRAFSIRLLGQKGIDETGMRLNRILSSSSSNRSKTKRIYNTEIEYPAAQRGSLIALHYAGFEYFILAVEEGSV